MYNVGVHCLSFPISGEMRNVQVCGAPLDLETSLVKVWPCSKEVNKYCITFKKINTFKKRNKKKLCYPKKFNGLTLPCIKKI